MHDITLKSRLHNYIIQRENRKGSSPHADDNPLFTLRAHEVEVQSVHHLLDRYQMCLARISVGLLRIIIDHNFQKHGAQCCYTHSRCWCVVGVCSARSRRSQRASGLTRDPGR